MTRLRAEIEGLIASSGVPQVGVGFHSFSTGDSFLVNGSLSLHAASMMKVPVMCEAFRQIEQGRITLDSPIEVVNCFPSLVDGSPFSLSPSDDSDQSLYRSIGSEVPLRLLIELMITKSGNLATNVLIAKLGVDRIQDLMSNLGAAGMHVVRGVEDAKAYKAGRNNAANAESYLRLMVLLVRGEVVSRQASAAMLDVMSRQQLRDGIPTGLPAGTKVAHKTGWTGDLEHDGGVVYAGDSPAFAVAVFTQGSSTREQAQQLIRSVARACWSGRPGS